MNFQNNQQRQNFSQKKGDIQPKPKKRININPTNSNAVDKVAAEKEKKAKSGKSKVINQWITEDDHHEPTPVKPLESHDTAYPSIGQSHVPSESTTNSTPVTTETKASGELSRIEEQTKNVENIEQKPEIPAENKAVESENTPQEPLQEASNHRNQRYENEGNQRRYQKNYHHNNSEKQHYGNQNYGNRNYYKNNNNNYYGGGNNRNNRRDDNYYNEDYCDDYSNDNRNKNYHAKKNDYNNSSDNYHGGYTNSNSNNKKGFKPQKGYDTRRQEIVYVKKN